MHFVWISEQTATFALYSINRLVLYNYRWRVFTARYELRTYITQTHFVFEGLCFIHVSFLTRSITGLMNSLRPKQWQEMVWNIARIRYLEFRKVELEPNLVVSSKLGSSETGSTICQKVSNDANNVVQIHLTEYALNQEIMFQSLIVLDALC